MTGASGVDRETAPRIHVSETEPMPRAAILWIQSSVGTLLAFLPPFPPSLWPLHALHSFLLYPSFTPAPCWRAETGEGPGCSSRLQVASVLFRVEWRKHPKANEKPQSAWQLRKRWVWACQLWAQADVRQLLNCLLPIHHLHLKNNEENVKRELVYLGVSIGLTSFNWGFHLKMIRYFFQYHLEWKEKVCNPGRNLEL